VLGTLSRAALIASLNVSKRSEILISVLTEWMRRHHGEGFSRAALQSRASSDARMPRHAPWQTRHATSGPGRCLVPGGRHKPRRGDILRAGLQRHSWGHIIAPHPSHEAPAIRSVNTDSGGATRSWSDHQSAQNCIPKREIGGRAS
jgi:hypothetical protein